MERERKWKEGKEEEEYGIVGHIVKLTRINMSRVTANRVMPTSINRNVSSAYRATCTAGSSLR